MGRGRSAAGSARGGRGRDRAGGSGRAGYLEAGGLAVPVRAMFRWLILGGGRSLALLVGLFVVCWLLVQLARSDVIARGHLRLDPGQVRLESKPSWVTPDVFAEIRASLASLGPFDLATPDCAVNLSRAIERSCPWVRAVREASKVYPRQSRVTLALRRPVALATLDGKRVALDPEGVVLPPAAGSLSWPNGGPIPRIVGIAATACPEAGCRVPENVELLEGLQVASDLARRSLGSRLDPVHLATIDVSGVPRPGREGRAASPGCEIVLRTVGGVEIWWGRSGRSPLAAVELSVTQKLEGLNLVLRRYPGLRGLERVCVAYEDPTIVKSSAPRQIGSQDGGGGRGG